MSHLSTFEIIKADVFIMTRSNIKAAHLIEVFFLLCSLKTPKYNYFVLIKDGKVLIRLLL